MTNKIKTQEVVSSEAYTSLTQAVSDLERDVPLSIVSKKITAELLSGLNETLDNKVVGKHEWSKLANALSAAEQRQSGSGRG